MMIVAEFRGSIRPAIPQIIALLSDNTSYTRKAGVDALAKLSERGKVSDSFIQHRR